MRTRPASIATIAIALGLALTMIGIGRQLPYTFAGHGDRATVAADAWAHGTAVSPALVALAVIGLLAAVSMRPTHGGRRASAWLAVLSGAVATAGLAEPVQQQALLLGSVDALTLFAWGFHASLVALVLSCAGEVRRGPAQPSAVEARRPELPDGEPLARGQRTGRASSAGALVTA
jgi:hypothetical protein